MDLYTEYIERYRIAGNVDTTLLFIASLPKLGTAIDPLGNRPTPLSFSVAFHALGEEEEQQAQHRRLPTAAHQRQVDETGRLPASRPLSRLRQPKNALPSSEEGAPAIGPGSAVSAQCLAHRERALFRLPQRHVSTGQEGLSDGPIPHEPGYGRELLPKRRSDVRCLVSPLLRHFQAEVDRLGERSLAAEAAFLALYKRLLRAVSAAHSGFAVCGGDKVAACVLARTSPQAGICATNGLKAHGRSCSSRGGADSVADGVRLPVEAPGAIRLAG
ncbi:hypothetical protein HPB49_018495 [Dermacentor silvarum]|uniref:Uncharacterized protein n=1 Tax=Dermacentor silvarum TaxID=543639 RepID=A0ACB8D771_DERSI|nr:hypothetical protein HPB49_018495 [Dermacentor silvarum]